MKILNNNIFKYILYYLFPAIAIFCLAFFGSQGKDEIMSSGVNLSNIVANNFNVSTDQLSEFYIIANTASSLDLASVNVVSSNYVTVSVMREAGQISGDITSIEKPQIVDTSSISRGVIAYDVKDGDTMESIAAELGISTDQIRWSNGLKTTEISIGQRLYLPNTPGIVYTAKAGDTVSSIISTYGSNYESVIAQNNLASNVLSEGMRIVLPGGTLPVTMRPEYVAPVVVRPTYVSSYTYLGNTSTRTNIEVIQNGFGAYGGYYWGQCTSYAYWYRNVSGLSPLGPIGSMWGNANTWASSARAAGYRVDGTPEVGAVFQTTAGYYGHVGVVVGINADGSIVVQEANYGYIPGRVTRATVPASAVGSLVYIH